MHKRLLAMAFSAVLALGFALYGSRANAQSEQPQGERRGGRPQMSPQDQLERLSKALDLTDDQKKQLTPILEDAQKQRQSLFSDQSMSREDRMAKMRSLREEGDKKIRAVLNDDQKKKFDDLQKEMRDRMQNRRGGGDNKESKQ